MTLDMMEIDHDSTLDDRVYHFSQDTRDLLGLGDWDIVVKMVDSLDSHDESDQVERYGQDVAQCTYREPYRIAEIRLVRGRDEAEYRESVMHEMLHLAIAPLDTTEAIISCIANNKTYLHIPRSIPIPDRDPRNKARYSVNAEQIEEIKRRVGNGERRRDVGRDMGIDRKLVGFIVRGTYCGMNNDG